MIDGYEYYEVYRGPDGWVLERRDFGASILLGRLKRKITEMP